MLGNVAAPLAVDVAVPGTASPSASGAPAVVVANVDVAAADTAPSPSRPACRLPRQPRHRFHNVTPRTVGLAASETVEDDATSHTVPVVVVYITAEVVTAPGVAKVAVVTNVIAKEVVAKVDVVEGNALLDDSSIEQRLLLTPAIPESFSLNATDSAKRGAIRRLRCREATHGVDSRVHSESLKGPIVAGFSLRRLPLKSCPTPGVSPPTTHRLIQSCRCAGGCRISVGRPVVGAGVASNGSSIGSDALP